MSPERRSCDFAEETSQEGLATIITVPMVDYVTADKKGRVTEDETAPSARWEKSLPRSLVRPRRSPT